MKKWMTFIFALLTFSICFLPVSAAEAEKDGSYSSDEQEIEVTISVKGYDSTVLIRDEEGKILQKVPVRAGTPYVYKETVKELKTYIRLISQEAKMDSDVVFDKSEYKVEITTFLDKKKPVSTTEVYRQDKKVKNVEFVNQKPGTPVTPDTPVPKTGDETPLMATILVAGVSFMMLLALIILKRRAAGNSRAERMK